MQEYYFESIPRSEFTRESTILNRTAHQNPATSKPGTILLTSNINSPFMIKEKIPKVKILIGRVKMVIKGFINVFKTPRTTATTTASKNVLMRTPA